MDFAAAVPGDDPDTGFTGDVARQKFIGDHDDFGDAEGFDDPAGVARGAADVGFGFDLGGGVHIGDDRAAGIFLAQQADIGAGDGCGERAAGARVGDQDLAVGIEQLGGLGHEMHAGHDDDIGLAFGGFAGQQQTVAHDVGDAEIDFGGLVIMREHDGVAFDLEALNRVDVVFEHGPFHRRDGLQQTIIGGGGLVGHCCSLLTFVVLVMSIS